MSRQSKNYIFFAEKIVNYVIGIVSLAMQV